MSDFGINTNIFETNVLNLAVVLLLVFSLGKDSFTVALDARLEKIINSLRSADDRFKQAQLELDSAKSELALAATKAKEIQNDGRQTIKNLREEDTKRYEELYRRFDVLKNETIRLEEEKVVKAFRQELLDTSFEKAIKGIRSFMNNDAAHQKYTNAKIALLESTPLPAYSN
jgi:F-type H+-transporting ATPase subunit b